MPTRHRGPDPQGRRPDTRARLRRRREEHPSSSRRSGTGSCSGTNQPERVRRCGAGRDDDVDGAASVCPGHFRPDPQDAIRPSSTSWRRNCRWPISRIVQPPRVIGSPCSQAVTSPESVGAGRPGKGPGTSHSVASDSVTSHGRLGTLGRVQLRFESPAPRAACSSAATPLGPDTGPCRPDSPARARVPPFHAGPARLHLADIAEGGDSGAVRSLQRVGRETLPRMGARLPDSGSRTRSRDDISWDGGPK
jgi:hypothetical protein